MSSTSNINPVILCILDGWGYNPNKEYNAIKLAHTPNWDKLVKNYPHTFITTHGEAVGLPAGQMGNSEVGHTNIGAGRIIYQDLPKISKAFKNHEVITNPAIKKAINDIKANQSTLHIMGLCSNGGIHSHIDHLIGSIKIFALKGIPIKLHLFTDGRDTPPKSALSFIEEINNTIKDLPNVSIATISGRYYAMDRDKRWERIELAYNAISSGEGLQFANPQDALEYSYNELVKNNRIASDEFIIPSVIANYKGIETNDAFFIINFRADRARQLLTSLVDPKFDRFNRKKIINFSTTLGMVNYSNDLDKFLTTIFPAPDLTNTLGEIISKNNLFQLRAAETEKYPHVTFFFNGGKESPFDKEDRILIPSPKVGTYDLKPEMSAFELKNKLLEAINSKKYSLIIINFANGDMVGHTGILSAAIKAVEAVDKCLGELTQAAEKNNYTMLITADHGNSETMWDEKNNAPHTQHTTNLVRLITFNPPKNFPHLGLKEGKLADLAPTILNLMGIKQPQEMSGESLVKV